MKKWQNVLWWIAIVVFIICVAWCGIYVFILPQAITEYATVKSISFIIICLLHIVPLVLTLCFGLEVVIRLRTAWHNTRSFDDPFFEQIDFYHHGSEDVKEYYLTQIAIINLFYKSKGEIDKLIKNKEIDRLYKRHDYLSTQIVMADDVMKYTISFIISIIASHMFSNMIEENNSIKSIVYICCLTIGFFMVLLLPYTKRGQLGSYMYKINKYEIELLDKKIQELEKTIEITEDDEIVLHTRQIFINELIKKKKGKKFDEIWSDIEELERCNLILEDYKKYKKVKIYINGTEGYIYYDKEMGRPYHYMGNVGLANQEYRRFVMLLEKYELIKYKI
ncbi:MAG: hypothetical protein HFG31_09050 [Eubacterium sp.]|nr:hypothetical protein [Eubacterium sp.]